MQPTKLFLNHGAEAATREQIAAVATPTRTSTWVPLPHDRLIDGVRDSLVRAGLTVVHEGHALTRHGARYFGLLHVANEAIGNTDPVNPPNDFALVVGLRNSHDQSFPCGLLAGANVFVCDNLSFCAEVKLARKHTVHVERDLPQLIERAVGQLGDLRRTQEQRFISYRHHELTDGAAHDLMIQALDARVLPVTQIPDVVREWREPRHVEFREGGRTAWRLFNAFTEVLKGRLDALPARTQALHGLLDATCGLAVSRN
jgi:Domain of unknown function (DUF932)